MSNPFGGLLSGLGNLEGVYPGQMWQQQATQCYYYPSATTFLGWLDATPVGATSPKVEGGYKRPEQEWLDRRVNEMRVKL